MSMKKKLKIVFLLILAAAVCVVFVLCYKAGVNMTLRRLISQEEEQEKEEEAPAPTPTEAPALFQQQEETAEPEQTLEPSAAPQKKYTYLLFKENLSGTLETDGIKAVKKGVKAYLNGSRAHDTVKEVTCTEYVFRSATRNQVYGYLKLDDGGILQYTYDFDRGEVKVRETAVTMQNLEDRKRQEEEAEAARAAQEEEDRKKEELAQEIFSRNEGGTATVQSSGTYVPSGSSSQSSGSPAVYVYPSGRSGSGYTGDGSEELITEDAFPYEEEEDESTDAEAILEELIPEDVFTDREAGQ